jgi:hypothetical protein
MGKDIPDHFRQNAQLFGVRGNGMQSRTLPSPVA